MDDSGQTLTTTQWCVWGNTKCWFNALGSRGRRSLYRDTSDTSAIWRKRFETHLCSHLCAWSRMWRDCTWGDVQGVKKIKGYQKNPVIVRQLIVSSGMKQRPLFCLLIRLRWCSVLNRCLCAVAMEEREALVAATSPRWAGAFWAALSHSSARRKCASCTFSTGTYLWLRVSACR